jgi:pyruvate formate lyase activating enzyme
MIWDIKKYALHDGPGIRTTVFFKGCPLRCAWCSNPESQSFTVELIWRREDCIGCGTCAAVCPVEAIALSAGEITLDRRRCTLCGECWRQCPGGALEKVGREPDPVQILEEVGRDSVFYFRTGGGLTLSGGEPLAQPDLAAALLHGYRSRLHGRHTVVETSACCPPDALECVLPHTDLFLADIKHMNPAAHRRFTGADNDRIIANLQRLAASPAQLVLRFPLIPGCNDDTENLTATAAFAVSLPGVECLDILPYHRLGEEKYARTGRSFPLQGTAPPTVKEIDQARNAFEKAGLRVRVGG